MNDCTVVEVQWDSLVECRRTVEADLGPLSSAVEVDIHQRGHMG